jgi:tetratricopeptide (TPR) repeat protein
MTEVGLNEAINHFRMALSLDPNYANAYAGLADGYASMSFLEFISPREAYPRAKEAVEKSLAIDSDLAEAHTSKALIKFQYEWDWRGAENEFQVAIGLNPSYASAHRFFSDYLKAMGRFDEAISEINLAYGLDPLSLEINTGLGHVLYLSRKYDEAIAQYKRAVELDPGFAKTHLWFGRPYLEKGMYAEAISELELAVKLSGDSTVALAMLGHALAAAG